MGCAPDQEAVQHSLTPSRKRGLLRIGAHSTCSHVCGVSLANFKRNATHRRHPCGPDLEARGKIGNVVAKSTPFVSSGLTRPLGKRVITISLAQSLASHLLRIGRGAQYFHVSTGGPSKSFSTTSLNPAAIRNLRARRPRRAE